ncbi:hypothetical protein ACFQX6_66665 [Streptosporangium lutulentum]
MTPRIPSRAGLRLLPGGDEHEQFPPGIAPGAGPGAMWGLGQVATYLGRSREAVRLYWLASRARAVDPHAATAADALPVPDFLLPDKGAACTGSSTSAARRPPSGGRWSRFVRCGGPR